MEQQSFPTAAIEGVLPPRLALRARYSSPLVWTLLYRALLLAIACNGVLALRVPLDSLNLPGAYRKDFIQEYLLGKAILYRADPYVSVADLAARFLGPLPDLTFLHPTPHPPVVGLLAVPLALLTYRQAAIAWFGFELACLVLSAYLIVAELRPAQRGPSAALALACCALLLPPFSQEIALGQLMIPLLLLVVLCWRSLRRQQDAAAGVLLGITLALKFVTWPLLLLFVWRRNWRSLVAAAGTALALNLAALVAIGPSAVVTYYLKVLPRVATLYRAHEANVSLNSIGWRLFAGTGSPVVVGATAPPLIASAAAAVSVSWLLPVSFLLAVALVMRRLRSWESAFGLLTCASLLVSPISWTHYEVLMGLPLCLAAFRLTARRFPWRVTAAAAVALLLMFVTNLTLHLFVWRFSSMQASWDQRFDVPPGVGLITLLPVVPMLLVMYVLWSLDRLPQPRGPAAP